MTTVAFGLLAYIVAAATLTPRLLAQRAWPRQMPRLGLGLWQAACVSVLMAFVVAALLLSLPARTVWHGIGAFVRVCMDLLRATYCPTSLPAFLAPVAMGLLATLAAWVGLLGVAQHWHTRRWRRNHRRRLRLLATEEDGVTVVSHPTPTVYAVPGPRGQVVMSSAAAQRLTAAQRAAALAHERAHLTGRHHLAVGCSRALERAFPGVPLFRAAHQQTSRLVELIADDRAVARHGRRALVGAIAAVAGSPMPGAGALAASGADTVERVQRLLAPPRTVPRLWRDTAVTATLLVLAAPALTVSLPMLVTAG
jgi:Zn-dependent protease with chaperone function